MQPAESLSHLIEIWWEAVESFSQLVEELPPEDWTRPTDLAGWTVHDVVAHVAHLEAVLAGTPEETLQFEPGPHVRGPLGMYTEQGVLARRELSPDALINELRSSATARQTALLADPPTDPTATPPVTPGGIGWDWATLLSNRPLDVWMHEQDIRRAVGRPGDLDSPAARHTIATLSRSLGYVLAKRVAAPPGTTVVLTVSGHEPVAATITEAGRGEPISAPADPTVTISMEPEAFVVAAGGRRAPEPGTVEYAGDQALGGQVVAALAVTP